MPFTTSPLMTRARSICFLTLLWVQGCVATYPTKPAVLDPIDVHASLSATPALGVTGERTVHVTFRDVQGQLDTAGREAMLNALLTRGYRAVAHADQASIRLDITWLRVNIGHVSDSEMAVMGNQEVSLQATLNGPTASARADGHTDAGTIGSANALSGAADFATGALRREVRFTAMADIDIRENNESGTAATHPSSTTHHLRGWVTASGPNLTWDESRPRIEQALMQSVAALFR